MRSNISCDPLHWQSSGGRSPKSEIRQHKKFYPACQSKCQPILAHMLEGMPLEDNPLLSNPAQGQDITIVYQDDAIVVVNKPAEFLSSPVCMCMILC